MVETDKILIAHRGLLDGPNSDKENTISTILSARTYGYDVEIDVWFKDNQWFLGHDRPQTLIDTKWLHIFDHGTDNNHHAWIHAKSITTLYQLQKIRWPGHVFFHENDPCVLTSTGFIWTYPGQQLTSHSICVLPEKTYNMAECRNLPVFAFCTDYINDLKAALAS